MLYVCPCMVVCAFVAAIVHLPVSARGTKCEYVCLLCVYAQMCVVVSVSAYMCVDVSCI